jgi:hypothetical protein
MTLPLLLLSRGGNRLSPRLWKEQIMAEEQPNAVNTSDDGAPIEEQSPSEKLSEGQPTIVPGAENPASTEVKRETNFNTE